MISLLLSIDNCKDIIKKGDIHGGEIYVRYPDS